MNKTGYGYYWFLHGCRPEPSKEIIGYNPEREGYRKSIGNYFGTKEEAEKAVKKLKAWKRLKDAGFTFNNKSIMDIEIGFIACDKDYDHSREDLDLLFGGEE